MDLLVGIEVVEQLLQECQEVDRALALVVQERHLAGFDVESGVQASGAAAHVVVGAGLRMASLGRQRALRHLPRPDLRLDVDRDQIRASGWSESSPATSRVF